MNPSISIAMTTFNGGRYLAQQLESLRAQKSRPYELVVCDDGSTDETLPILRAFAATADFPVRIFLNEENLGFADNFLHCASLCTGNWIAFSDQDDVWLPNKLARVAETIAEGNERLAIVCHSGLLANDDLDLSGRRVPDYPRRTRTRQGTNYGFICIPGFTITFRASLLCGIDSALRPHDYYDRRRVLLSHDKWVPLLANLLGEITYLPDNLAIYRRHDSALSGTYAAQTAAGRVNKSLGVGHDYYAFQATAANECAQSLRQIAAGFSNIPRKSALLAGAEMYETLSYVCGLRERVYRAPTALARITSILRVLRAGGYWGDRFSAYGTLSLAKDLYCSMR
jgi:glycosyltransferase involved in cell wall biosynthesis